ncbi:MAG: zinc-binding alcohol dehydrogenase family protein [Elusimicrobiota bacterium]
MKVIGYKKSLPISETESLLDFQLPVPTPLESDLLVEIKAVSVNPVDTKVRQRYIPKIDEMKVLGWDAAGVVKSTGPDCTLFKPGDEVWYAGALGRSGTNAQLHLVDERIVGKKPKSLSFAQAAALPLTSITAWEILFDRFQLQLEKQQVDKSILIIGAGGGVGSILIQLARQLTGLHIIATASRPETKKWVEELGAHQVVDYRGFLAQNIKNLNAPPVHYVASLTETHSHFNAISELIAPQGKLCLIDDPEQLEINKLKQKSISLHWEFMFTKSLFNTSDLISQHHLLNQISDLVDQGKIKTTLKQNLGKINAENLKRAHAILESGQSTGKIVLENF